MTPEETGGRQLDVVLVTGDAYVDHPSWGVAAVGRWLEAHGFSVGIIAQPDWQDVDAFRVLGRPRLFFGVTAGNMDSMVNRYTASRRLRSKDAYAPGGEMGLRPDRATIPYVGKCRQAFSGVPVVIGGIEASLRRLVHYDFWQDKIRGSILLDSQGRPAGPRHGRARGRRAIARALDAGRGVAGCRDIPGVAYALGAKEEPPEGPDVVELPSLEPIAARDPLAFNRVTYLMYRESNPHCGKVLVQQPTAAALRRAEPAVRPAHHRGAGPAARAALRLTRHIPATASRSRPSPASPARSSSTAAARVGARSARSPSTRARTSPAGRPRASSAS